MAIVDVVSISLQVDVSSIKLLVQRRTPSLVERSHVTTPTGR